MLNTVILMGRLTADPELRTTSSGVSVARFSLAVDRDYQGNGAERATDFIDVVAWRQRAEFVSKYFRKGQQVAVKGSIQTGSYTDKDGNKRRTWEVVADNVYFADSKRDSASSENTGYGNSSYSNNTVNEQPAAFSNGTSEDFTPIIDDDLPF